MSLGALVDKRFSPPLAKSGPDEVCPKRHGVGSSGGAVAVVAESQARFGLVVPYALEAPVEVVPGLRPPGSRNLQVLEVKVGGGEIGGSRPFRKSSRGSRARTHLTRAINQNPIDKIPGLCGPTSPFGHRLVDLGRHRRVGPRENRRRFFNYFRDTSLARPSLRPELTRAPVWCMVVHLGGWQW